MTSRQLSAPVVVAMPQTNFAVPALTSDTSIVGQAGLSLADRAALATFGEALRAARSAADSRPAFVVLASLLGDLGVTVPHPQASVSLPQERDAWLQRLRSTGRCSSTIDAYRIALNDFIDFVERTDRGSGAPDEQLVVAYLDDYRRRKSPAESTYVRRFTLLRHFSAWLSSHAGVTNPFAELAPPRKPRQESDWLTPEEFQRMLAAAERPLKRRTGLAERDRLVLLTLVTTGLRRSELIALDWADLDLEGATPSLLVRRGKGGRPRRQPLPRSLADELGRERIRGAGSATDPVFCGLGGRRLQPTILANIIRRTACRAGLEKHVTVHTLRHTAATWLRQATGDTRLVADFLGHADQSTVNRYAHVALNELHDGAAALAARAGLPIAGSGIDPVAA